MSTATSTPAYYGIWTLYSFLCAIVLFATGWIDHLESMGQTRFLGSIIMMVGIPTLITMWLMKPVGNTYANYTRGLKAGVIGETYFIDIWQPFSIDRFSVVHDLGGGDIGKLKKGDEKTTSKVRALSGIVCVTGGHMEARKGSVHYLNENFSGNGRIFVALYPSVESEATAASISGNLMFPNWTQLFAIGSTDGHVANFPVTNIGVKSKTSVQDAVASVINALSFAPGLWLAGSFTFLFLNMFPELKGERVFRTMYRSELISLMEEFVEHGNDTEKHNAGILLSVLRRCWWIQWVCIGSRK